MKINQAAAQLYTCRDLLGTPAGIATTLARLRKIGFTAVEAAGLGPIADADFAKLLADTGLICCSIHADPTEILSSPAKVIDRLGTLGCKFAAYPYPQGIDLSSPQIVGKFIAQLQSSAETFARAGVQLAYHHHNLEFRKLAGRIILEMIMEAAPSLYVQPDTYWLQYGGANIIAWLEKLASRMTTIHLKDYATTSENTPLWTEIGQGVLDFKSIIPAAEKSGCQWFIIEQDSTPADPVDSLATSFQYLREANLLSAD